MSEEERILKEYIVYIGDTEFVNDLTIPEKVLYIGQIKNSLGFAMYKLKKAWKIFLKKVALNKRRMIMNRTTRINILAYASNPDKDIDYDGDIIEYNGKIYFVSLAEEHVEFIGVVKNEDKEND